MTDKTGVIERSRPRLLDLFCGAGGSAKGYARAGFEVVGVDVYPQPNYPFEFHQLDAMEALAHWKSDGLWPGVHSFDVIHASPPCPRYSAGTASEHRDRHPDLIDPVREALTRLNRLWIIENVEGAPLQVKANLFDPQCGVMLCGSMFGMKIRRHRLFECSVPLSQPACRHWAQPIVLSVTGTGYGGKHKGHNGTKPSGIAEAREVMGVDWPMTIRELSNAIPPAYTEWIGRQFVEHLQPLESGASQGSET